MENKMLALKVYDVDYSFIIKNYLDQKLWEKEWTIFTYKRFEITLKLDSIGIKDRRVWFEVMIKDDNEENRNYFGKSVKDTFSYALSIESINVLKNTLNHTIFCLMQQLEEESYIEFTEEYKRLQNMKEEEQDKLKDIAEEFLDDERVTNEEIREAYIEYYIDKNESVYRLINNYESDMKYKMITDFYVAFLESTDDKDRLEIIRQRIGSSKLEKTLEKIKEYEEYMKTEEFEEEMRDNLEEV